MAWFEGTHTETRTIPGSVDAVRAHFADPAAIVANTEDLESSEVDGGTIHFVLKLQDHGVAKFKGDYRCTYAVEDGVLTWSTAEGANTRQSGKATFKDLGDGQTELAYEETVAVDMEVAAMMAPMLKPVVSQVLAHAIKGYVKRMVAALPA